MCAQLGSRHHPRAARGTQTSAPACSVVVNIIATTNNQRRLSFEMLMDASKCASIRPLAAGTQTPANTYACKTPPTHQGNTNFVCLNAQTRTWSQLSPPLPAMPASVRPCGMSTTCDDTETRSRPGVSQHKRDKEHQDDTAGDMKRHTAELSQHGPCVTLTSAPTN